MVENSLRNFEKHKEDIFNILKDRYGVDRAKKFLRFYDDRYGDFNRSFLDYKLAFWLLDDYHYVKRVGTRWYACVGVGGSGKSTLLKNVFYFLDKSFDLSRIHTSTADLINCIDSFPIVDSMNATFLDEPDDDAFPTSRLGKKLKRIFGKARQMKAFFGICATDLKDIPTYIFRKLDVIIFCPYQGHYMAFKNKAKRHSYVLQNIRKEYEDLGYAVFFKYKKQLGCLEGHTLKHTPIDNEDKLYLKEKKKDFKNDIKDYIKISSGNTDKKDDLSKRNQMILNMKKKGLKNSEIANFVGMTRARITQIINENKKR